MRSCSFLAAGLLLAAGCASSSTTATSSTVTPRAASVGKFVWHDRSTDDLPAAERCPPGSLTVDRLHVVADVDAAVLYRALSRREQCAEGELGQP